MSFPDANTNKRLAKDEEFRNVAAQRSFRYDRFPVGASGATPQTLNMRMGTVTFTGIASVSAGTDGGVAQVINNTIVTPNTIAFLQISQQTVAANSLLTIKNVAYGAGTITLTLNNPTTTATGAAGSITVTMELKN